MKTSHRKSFTKDLKKLKDRSLRERVRQVIEDVKAADQPQDIVGLKKLSGTDDRYRIRVGEYRLGIRIAGDEVVFLRCLHRRDLYRYFP
jgi:mRNA interferase RelE/StbE